MKRVSETEAVAYGAPCQWFCEAISVGLVWSDGEGQVGMQALRL